MDDNNRNLPAIPETAYGIVAIKTALSAIPYVGGPLSTLAGEFGDPRIRRIADFCNNYVKPAIERHEKLLRGKEEERKEYFKSDGFQDMMHEVLEKTARESREEKLRAYANFFTHAILEANDDFDELRDFLRIIDWLSTRQLIILGIWWRILTDSDFKLQLHETKLRPLSLSDAMVRYCKAYKLGQPKVKFEDKGQFEFFGILRKTTDYDDWTKAIKLLTDFGSKFNFRGLTEKGQKFLEYVASEAN